MSGTLSTIDKERLLIWLVLLRRVDAFKKTVDARLNEQFGISISRFDVLSALERKGSGGLKAGELTKQLYASDGNTTQVANKLVRDGYVERTVDEKDRRCIIYTLTQKGALEFEDMAICNAAQVSDILKNYTADDLAALKSLLGKLNLKTNINK